ncbi:MAG: hypothetical protein HC936_06040, partial [Leptolyngbyaceae cyanobacterium SU_3_3]|nr:hypothetical protein [Leptolyngbyaceae cyanobacterium SU_3_3]
MSLSPQLTADGSFTFFSPEFGEAFHSKHGARQEAESKFVGPTLLREKVDGSALRILDVCYGLGYNTAAALAAIWQVDRRGRIEVVALEIDGTVPQRAIADQFLSHWHPKIQNLLAQLAQGGLVETADFKGRLWLGDARQTLQQLETDAFDAIFLDPFSPPHCPQLWTIEFLSLMAQLLKPDGRLATYSCCAAVRAGLLQAGLTIAASDRTGQRSPGTIAYWGSGLADLSPREAEHLLTRAAVPYRDPTLSDSPAEILHRRQIERESSPLELPSRWKRRWTQALLQFSRPRIEGA